MIDPSLLPFFFPRGIVIVGASTSPEKLGYGVARNLIHCGYQGAVHLVGHKQGQLFGRPLHTSLDHIPDPVDLAILVLPPQATPQAVEHCGRRGIRAVIIVSSGFREVGDEGAMLEKECLRIARDRGIRLLGPNCVGTIDTHLPLDTTFLPPPMPAQGSIGFLSHSGAFCAAIVDWARSQGFGFSRIVSLGNQADVNETDILSALGEDEHTRVIVMYLEGVSDGMRFVEVARQVTQHKPVIALKAGRFESGQKAAASHTGALAASDVAFDAAFEKANILRADSAEQMFDWARIFDSYPHGFDTPQTGRGVSGGHPHGIAILTNAGGPGVMAVDALDKNGLSLAKLHEPTLKALISELPPAANVFNPVDMLASASPETYAACLRILLGDDNVDGVLIVLPPPPMYKAEQVAENIIRVMESDSAQSLSSKPLDSKNNKPVLVALLGSSLIEEARSAFERAKIPTFPFPERAASAFGALARRAEHVNAATPRQEVSGDIQSLWISGDHHNPHEILAAYKIESVPIKLACSLEEAEFTANEIGYPVVMKIASPDILHKSDVDGVALNIRTAAELTAVYIQLMEKVSAAKPGARIDGVHLQRQIPDGQEVIVGAVRDPLFGPLMMFGSGGVEVEGLKDVAFALAPLTRAEALTMIRRTWAGQKLAGYRNLPAADEESVVDVLVDLSRLIMENGAIQEIEINPLNVSDKGAVAVDVRIEY